jgi:hypothetical protein
MEYNPGDYHSMCRECWNKRHGPRSRSVGHEIPKSLRVWETCCFCLTRHKDGLRVRKNPKSRELRCGGRHYSK